MKGAGWGWNLGRWAAVPAILLGVIGGAAEGQCASVVRGPRFDGPILEGAPGPVQMVTPDPPPAAPSVFNPDPGVPPVGPRSEDDRRVMLRWRRRITTTAAPLPAKIFNPDPGGGVIVSERTMFEVPRGEEPSPPVEENVALPRREVSILDLEVNSVETPSWVPDAIPSTMELPRSRVRSNVPIEQRFPLPPYVPNEETKAASGGSLTERRGRSSEVAGDGIRTVSGEAASPFGLHSVARPDRWKIELVPWQRYGTEETETPYQTVEPARWHPYRQSYLKGDLPIWGQDIFLKTTADLSTEFQLRHLPGPQGFKAVRGDSVLYYGDIEQMSVNNALSVTVDLFQGEAAARPADWRIRVQPALNVNYSQLKETGVVAVAPSGSGNAVGSFEKSALTSQAAIQEAYGEVVLREFSPNYDVMMVRAGSQAFSSDFRGFLLNDLNLGVRLFGQADNNRYQYNLGVFPMLEKETISQLNTFKLRNQWVAVGNLYRRDFLVPGYTAELSLHGNLDGGGTHRNSFDTQTRPLPGGVVPEHEVQVVYVGWAGHGHLGRINVSHAFYQAFGKDEFNGFAGRSIDINARMAALELSIDDDWLRYKVSTFYASGDGDREDGTGGGFDSIVDNVDFAGGPFSYYGMQGFGLGATSGIGFKQSRSLLPNLRTSKTEGQANFVNPGLLLAGGGIEAAVTPALRGFAHLNYLWFADTSSLADSEGPVGGEIGLDTGVGLQYRPWLTPNAVVTLGVGFLVPGNGLKGIHGRPNPAAGAGGGGNPNELEDVLYNGLLAVRLRY